MLVVTPQVVEGKRRRNDGGVQCLMNFNNGKEGTHLEVNLRKLGYRKTILIYCPSAWSRFEPCDESKTRN